MSVTPSHGLWDLWSSIPSTSGISSLCSLSVHDFNCLSILLIFSKNQLLALFLPLPSVSSFLGSWSFCYYDLLFLHTVLPGSSLARSPRAAPRGTDFRMLPVPDVTTYSSKLSSKPCLVASHRFPRDTCPWSFDPSCFLISLVISSLIHESFVDSWIIYRYLGFS